MIVPLMGKKTVTTLDPKSGNAIKNLRDILINKIKSKWKCIICNFKAYEVQLSSSLFDITQWPA